MLTKAVRNPEKADEFVRSRFKAKVIFSILLPTGISEKSKVLSTLSIEYAPCLVPKK